METKNFVVIGTVCAMLGLYAIAVVFARRADRSDSQKVSIFKINNIKVISKKIITSVRCSHRDKSIFKEGLVKI